MWVGRIYFIKIMVSHLLHEEQYSAEDITHAALIVHPTLSGYNITKDQIAHLFEEWSNFTHLKQPIYDEHNNEFRDSEWYYMAKRTNNTEIKKMIAFLSIWYWLSRKARKKYILEQDLEKRALFMQEAIAKKFDTNEDLQILLMNTWQRVIIEYTYRNDTFFGIDQHTLRWMNVLWKLLMEYRDHVGLYKVN